MRVAAVTLTILLFAAVAQATPDPGSCDRDSDAQITARDALIALQDALSICRRTYACDSDGDEYMTVTDALALLRYAVGMPQVLACSCIAFDECFSDEACADREPFTFCVDYLCSECDLDTDCDEGEFCDRGCTMTCLPAE